MPDDEPHVALPEAPVRDEPAAAVVGVADDRVEPAAAPVGVADVRAEPAPALVEVVPDRVEPVPPRATTTLGAYTIWVADKGGRKIDPPTNRKVPDRDPNPSYPDAVLIN